MTSTAATQVDRALEVLSGRPLVALTGAGMSTDSGIPDYRGPGSPLRRPMTYGEFVSGEATIVERGPDGRPLREIVDAVDNHGRELHAEGQAISTLKFTGYNDFFNWWSLGRWEFDGQIAWGELQEVYPFRVSRRFRRSLRG